MSIEALKEKLPEYARDQRLNLAALVMDTLLSEQQRWGTLVATALASRNPKVIAAILSAAIGRRPGIGSGTTRTDAKSAGSINIGDRAAAGADRVDIDHRRQHRVA